MGIEYKFANGVIPFELLKACAEDDGYEVGIDSDGCHYIKHTCPAWLSMTEINGQKAITGFSASIGARVYDLALWLQAYFHVRIEFSLDNHDAFIQACEFQAKVDQHKCLQHFLMIYCLLDLLQRNQLHRALLCTDEVDDEEVQNLLHIANSVFSEKERELLMNMLMRNAVAAMDYTERSYASDWQKHKKSKGLNIDQFIQQVKQKKDTDHATA